MSDLSITGHGRERWTHDQGTTGSVKILWYIGEPSKSDLQIAPFILSQIIRVRKAFAPATKASSSDGARLAIGLSYTTPLENGMYSLRPTCRCANFQLTRTLTIGRPRSYGRTLRGWKHNILPLLHSGAFGNQYNIRNEQCLSFGKVRLLCLLWN